MNKQKLLLTGLLCSPLLCFASTGDTTFSDIVTALEGYLGGSLGLVFVLIGFLGAGAAIAGMAPMKLMFPVFGLTLALHYGPKALETIFGATGDYYPGNLHHTPSFNLADMVMLMLTTGLIAIAYHKKQAGLK